MHREEIGAFLAVYLVIQALLSPSSCSSWKSGASDLLPASGIAKLLWIEFKRKKPVQVFGLPGYHFDLCGALLSFPMKMISAAVVTVFLLGSMYVGITVIEVRADSSSTEKRGNINNSNNKMKDVICYRMSQKRTGEKERVGNYSEVPRPKTVKPFPRNFFYPSILVALCFPYKLLTNPEARAPTGMEKSFKITAKIIYFTPQRHAFILNSLAVFISSQFHPPNPRTS